MRCPHCGAHNADSADWCTQCYTALNESASDPETAEQETSGQETSGQETTVAPPGDEPVPPAAVPTPSGPAGSASPETRAGTPAGTGPDTTGPGFRRVEDDVEWRCAVCEQWNSLESNVCTVCGVGFEETVGVVEEEPELRDVEPTAAVIASAVLPGLGHALLGRVGSGVIRGATFVLWLIGGLVLLRGASGAGQSILPATPLLIGAGALWLLGMNDTAVLSGALAGRELLTPRVFLWLVVGVVGALILAFIPALLRVTGEGVAMPLM